MNIFWRRTGFYNMLLERFKKREQIDNKVAIDKLLWGLLYALPLIMNPTSRDAFAMTKAILLWTISLSVLILYIKEKNFDFGRGDKLIFIYLGIVSISTLFSKDLMFSIMGDSFRWEGLITIFSYGIVFIVAKKYIIITAKKIDIFLYFGVLSALYSIFQFWNIDIIYKKFLKSEFGISSSALLGNRNFFSSYLIILLSLSIGLYFKNNQKKYLFISLINFISLLCAQTRGCWIAFGVIIFIYTIKEIFYDKNYKDTIILLVILFLGYMSIAFTKNCEIYNRSKSMVNTVYSFLMGPNNSVTDSSVTENSASDYDRLGSGRVGIWKVSIKVFAKHPLLGCGLENLDDTIAFEFGDWNREWRERTETIVDRAHNELLHIAATTGVIAIIVYLILVLGILKKNFKLNDSKRFIIFMIILGYLIQANFNISVVGVAPIFWIVLGIGSRDGIENNVYDAN